MNTNNAIRSHLPPIRWIKSLYDWVIHWSKTTHAKAALFLIAFAESSFFPIPPDVLLMAMGVSEPKKALRFAGICLVGSVLGGVAGYYIGMGLWHMISDLFFQYVPGFSQALFDKVAGMYQEHAFWAVFTAGFTPVPYKVFTIAAGVAEISLSQFILASILSRGLRFFMVGGALRFFGAPVKTFIEKYFDILTIVFTVLFIGGFVALKFLFQ